MYYLFDCPRVSLSNNYNYKLRTVCNFSRRNPTLSLLCKCFGYANTDVRRAKFEGLFVGTLQTTGYAITNGLFLSVANGWEWFHTGGYGLGTRQPSPSKITWKAGTSAQCGCFAH